MKKIAALSLCFSCFAAVSISRAIDLKQSKVTQVVNDVEIISAADQSEKTAAVNDIFTMPDILRTGPASRAELVASDETITRVGANTIFSFDPASRTIDLKQGSLLFHSPHGKGGGTIHTGSATASVLGSTLIVTTTSNGGFKVLVLEDGAEIKFLNGLTQKLEPGQMTFILPGGNQLAPILIFRLDDLTKNSLLVKGFNHPLDSMPLILHEIEKQLKLIKSGKFSDTGLIAGDNAGPNQVEVLDVNSIQSDLNTFNHGSSGQTTPEQAALAADATINQPSLTDASIPVPPDRIFFDSSFTLSGNNFFNGKTFGGFAGGNIFFNTENLESLDVDLSPYAAQSEFDFVAADNLNIGGPVTFSGLPSAGSLFLFAGHQISITPDVTVEADVTDFELSAPMSLTLDGSRLLNDVGAIALTSGSTITLDDDAEIHAEGHTTFTAPKAVNILGTDVIIEDTTINTDPTKGSVSMTSSDGEINLTGTSITTHVLTLNSGDGILLDGNGQTFTASGKNATANFTAPNQITVQNADFSSFATLNMVANTIDIINAILPPIANFGTSTGEANVNGTEIPGGLNIYNSSQRTSGGIVAITSTEQITFSDGPGNSPGIYSYSTGGGGGEDEEIFNSVSHRFH
jgi:FecR protein